MILLDSGVLIDDALDRRPHSGPASELLDRIEHGGEGACIARHTVSNFYYIVAHASGAASSRDFVVELTHFMSGQHRHGVNPLCRGAADGRLRERHAGRRCLSLRCPAQRIEEREGLTALTLPAIDPQAALGGLP